MITKEQRAELRRLCENATPGPWIDDAFIGTDDYDDPDTPVVMRPGKQNIIVPMEYGLSYDADFIASSRSAVPALLDALDAAEAENARLRAELADAKEITVDTCGDNVTLQEELIYARRERCEQARECMRLRECAARRTDVKVFRVEMPTAENNYTFYFTAPHTWDDGRIYREMCAFMDLYTDLLQSMIEAHNKGKASA